MAAEQEVCQCSTTEEHRAHEIDLQRLAPLFPADVLDRPLRPVHTGVRDHDVQTSEGGYGGVDEAPDVLWHRDIGRRGEYPVFVPRQLGQLLPGAAELGRVERP